MNSCKTAVVLLFLIAALGCGTGSSSITPPGLSVALSPNAATLYQNQSTATVNVTLTRTGSTGNVTLTLQGVPPSVSTQIQSPGTGNSSSIILTALPPASPASLGTFPVTVTASYGQTSGSATLQLTVGAYVQLNSASSGKMNLAMSTSFQPAEWDYQLFQRFLNVTTPLGNLQPSHIRLQPVSQGVPQTSTTTWDFKVLDAITQPVLTVGDQKPEFQIAVAPPFMAGSPTFNADFATYAANLVSYYNSPSGFIDAGGTPHKSPSGNPIKLWGIYNEPNYNNLDPTAYTTLYNTVVPAMLGVDSTIQLVAVELGDAPGEADTFLPAFAAGVTAPVTYLATHFYSSCNQKDSDETVFNTVPGFATEVERIYFILSNPPANPNLATVPVWVTENNVNADFADKNGMSTCNPGQTFVVDPRGSTAFFAAWRPYVFSQLGKAGTAALYQWVYAGDAQYGEIDDTTGNLRLAYWVDYWLERKFPSPTGAAQLQYYATDEAEVETLAVQNPDNSVVVMIANHAVNATSDNNGPGAPRSVLVDIAQLPTPFQTASLLTIDAKTNPGTGPTEGSVTLAQQIPVTFNGYGVAFLTLK